MPITRWTDDWSARWGFRHLRRRAAGWRGSEPKGLLRRPVGILVVFRHLPRSGRLADRVV